jgi:hypothetical protein
MAVPKKMNALGAPALGAARGQIGRNDEAEDAAHLHGNEIMQGAAHGPDDHGRGAEDKDNQAGQCHRL